MDHGCELISPILQTLEIEVSNMLNNPGNIGKVSFSIVSYPRNLENLSFPISSYPGNIGNVNFLIFYSSTILEIYYGHWIFHISS